MLRLWWTTAEVPGGRTSSAAAVDIQILTPRPKLEVLGPIYFKDVQVGTVGYAKFAVRNVGRDTFRGELELLAPFAADRRILSVEPGATEQVQVEFRPVVPGKVGTYLQLQDDQKSSVLGIFAEAIPPFQVASSEIELPALLVGGMRQGRVSLSNLTDKPIAVGIAAGIGYAHLMVHGLKTWWFDAIGTQYLEVYLQPISLLAGR